MTAAVETLTPMMQQYRRIKESVPDSILLFRLGDFYEMFFEDAQKASKILNIALTAREAGPHGKAPMCGVPFHAAENYIARLITAGNKVAICDQVEDPKAAKGIVRREVTRIITPGTVLEQNLLGDKAHNYIACVTKGAGQYGMAFLDLSTGQFKLTEIIAAEDLASEIHKLRPSEAILPKSLAEDAGWKSGVFPHSLLINVFEDWEFDSAKSTRLLLEHFRVGTLDGFGCQGLDAGVSAAGAILRYLKDNRYEKLSHVRALQPFSNAQFMVIDAISQRNLELVSSLANPQSKEATLLSVLDDTVTAMGCRTLKDWMLNPLLSAEKIARRQDAVAELMEKPGRLSALRDALKGVADLERLHGRLACGFGNARDLGALRDSLNQLPGVQGFLEGVQSEALVWIARNLPDLKELAAHIGRAIVDSPPISLREGGFIRPGFDAQLDDLLSIATQGHDWLAELQRREIERTGIKSLKVKYNKVFGYFIEISNTNLGSVPADYVRKQTMVNGERFITQELKEYETKVLSAQERSQQLEYELFSRVRDEVLKHSDRIVLAGQTLGGLDCLLSLALVALENDYVRPSVDESDALVIEDGRHPVLETLLDENRFIPNDVQLNNGEDQILLITGPNMAGKSTYIRQVALLVLMAQMGSFIPAKKAQIGLVDRIFTRVGASDALARGQSTFMVEMSETANILNNATPRSLIILDEIGRGTSTFDGLSIAWAVCEFLHQQADKKAKTLFATHYHELTELEQLYSGIKNYSIAVREWNDEIVFLRKIIRGATDKSYGIHVAKLAGLPRKAVDRAVEVLRKLEESHLRDKEALRTDAAEKPAQPVQKTLFEAVEHPVVAELKALTPEELSPLAALQKLYEWKKRL